MTLNKSTVLLQKRRWRIRKKISGTSQRPRLVVTFSHQHIYAQCIDDQNFSTLLFLSTLSRDLKNTPIKPNIEGARILGRIFGEKARQAGILSVVFDRAGRCYHGCVQAFADSARETGLLF